VRLWVAVEQQHWRAAPTVPHADLGLAGIDSRELEAGEERQSAPQTASFCFVLWINSSVNSRLDAGPTQIGGAHAVGNRRASSP
jgi:hypothetical protein